MVGVGHHHDTTKGRAWMSRDWQVSEGTGWIGLDGVGQINPRRDSVDGGRQYFTAKTIDDDFADIRGESVTGGPETWYFEFDESFALRDPRSGSVLEVQISLLPGGKYSVKYRDGEWPHDSTGGW
jgi:hypothetical protein